MNTENYTLTEEIINLGGVVRSSVDLVDYDVEGIDQTDIFDYWQDERLTIGQFLAASGAKPGTGGLSTVHISPRKRDEVGFFPVAPFVEYYKGSSLLRVCHAQGQGGTDARVKGKRGLASFSAASRRRLVRTIAITKRSCLPLFVTLTYPFIFPTDNKIYKRHLDSFLKRLARAFPGSSAIWKLEPQQRGAAHYHLLVWGVSHADLFSFVPSAWYAIAGGGDERHLLFHQGKFANRPCVEVPKSYNGVMSYVAKYMSKEVLNGWAGVGRWWGVFNKENLPVGEVVRVDISEKQARDLFRGMRRYARKPVYKKVWEDGVKKVLYINNKPVILKFRKMRAYAFPSLSILCNADSFIAQFQGVNGSSYLEFLKGKQGL